MSFPKKGKFLPTQEPYGANDARPSDEMKFAAEIASALEKTLQHGERRIKTIAGWTGANERTVKNWLSGKYGPCGTHLIVLMRCSDEVLNSVLSMAGVHDILVAQKLVLMERHLHRVELSVGGQPLDGGHLMAVGLHGEDVAGLHALAVQVDGARPAVAGVAPDDGPGLAERLA